MKPRQVLIAAAVASTLVAMAAGCSSESSNVDAAPRTDATPRADADPNAPDARTAAMDGMPACVVTDASGTSDIGGHSLVIPAADITNQATSVFPSTGGGHAHNVLISSTQLGELTGNCALTVMSSDMHPHTWTITMP